MSKQMTRDTSAAPMAIADIETGISRSMTASPVVEHSYDADSKSLPEWIFILVACVALAACTLCPYLASATVPSLKTVDLPGKLTAFKVILPFGTLPLDQGEGALVRAGPIDFMEFAPKAVQPWGAVTIHAAQENVVNGTHAATAVSGPRAVVSTVLGGQDGFLHATARAAAFLLFQGTSAAGTLLRAENVLSWSLWWMPVTVLVLLILAIFIKIVSFAVPRASAKGASKPAKRSELTACEPLSEDDMDLLEAFDDLDRGRQGFVHCAALRTLVGNPATESDVIRAVVALTPNYGVLFYADFMRLAQRPGPLADLLAERKARRHRLVAAQCKSSLVSPKHAAKHYTRRVKA